MKVSGAGHGITVSEKRYSGVRATCNGSRPAWRGFDAGTISVGRGLPRILEKELIAHGIIDHGAGGPTNLLDRNASGLEFRAQAVRRRHGNLHSPCHPDRSR